jgi:hypothetical protein
MLFFLRPCLTSFHFPLEWNCQNRAKCMFAKHDLKPKFLLSKQWQTKQGFNHWPNFDLTELTWNLWCDHKLKYTDLTHKTNQNQNQNLNQNLKWIKVKKKNTKTQKSLYQNGLKPRKIKNTKNTKEHWNQFQQHELESEPISWNKKGIKRL